MAFFQGIFSYVTGPFFPWKSLIISLSLGKFTFESYLALRQYRVLCKQRLPAVLAKDVDQATFDKSQAYGRAKAKLSLYSSLLHTLIDTAFMRYNVLFKIWQWSGDMLLNLAPSYAGITSHSILFAVAYLLVHMAISLPASVYHIFVVEAEFGFNKQSLPSFAADQAKTVAITSAIIAPSVAALLAIAQRAGSRLGLYLCAAGVGIQVAVVTVYPIFILPLFFKLTPPEGKELVGKVRGLAERLSFPLTKLYVADGSARSGHSNAMFFGFPWQKNIVVFDTLLEHLSTDEVVAVIGHELGHWKMGHTAWQFALSQLDLIFRVGVFTVFMSNKALYSSFGFTAGQPVLVGFLLFGQALPPINAALKLLMNHVSRRHEFQADDFAQRLGYRAQLSTALVKLQLKNLSSFDADPVYSRYHHSHPLLAERLAALS